jgi:hypothetical protein
MIWTLTNILPEVPRDIPAKSWRHWVRYSSAWESNKRTCRDLAVLPASIVKALAYLSSPQFTEKMANLTGIRELIPAPFAHGGGLHVTDPGGKLDTHLDYALHPGATWLERRVNVIVFLNDATGNLQFWNDDASKVVREFAPKTNCAVVWESDDLAYHSVTEVTGRIPRATLASYFCAPARAGVTRKRALWCPVRG